MVAPPPRSPFKRADRLRATGKRTKQMSWPLLGLSGCYWTDLATFSIRSFKLLLPFPSALPSLSCRGQNTFTIFTWGQPAKDLCSLCVHKTVSYLCSRENSSGWSLMQLFGECWATANDLSYRHVSRKWLCLPSRQTHTHPTGGCTLIGGLERRGGEGWRRQLDGPSSLLSLLCAFPRHHFIVLDLYRNQSKLDSTF